MSSYEVVWTIGIILCIVGIVLFMFGKGDGSLSLSVKDIGIEGPVSIVLFIIGIGLIVWAESDPRFEKSGGNAQSEINPPITTPFNDSYPGIIELENGECVISFESTIYSIDYTIRLKDGNKFILNERGSNQSGRSNEYGLKLTNKPRLLIVKASFNQFLQGTETARIEIKIKDRNTNKVIKKHSINSSDSNKEIQQWLIRK